MAGSDVKTVLISLRSAFPAHLSRRAATLIFFSGNLQGRVPHAPGSSDCNLNPFRVVSLLVKFDVLTVFQRSSSGMWRRVVWYVLKIYRIHHQGTCLTYLPWRWRQQAPLKWPCVCTTLNCPTACKTLSIFSLVFLFFRLLHDCMVLYGCESMSLTKLFIQLQQHVHLWYIIIQSYLCIYTPKVRLLE